jgi:hypothetical protein
MTSLRPLALRRRNESKCLWLPAVQPENGIKHNDGAIFSTRRSNWSLSQTYFPTCGIYGPVPAMRVRHRKRRLGCLQSWRQARVFVLARPGTPCSSEATAARVAFARVFGGKKVPFGRSPLLQSPLAISSSPRPLSRLCYLVTTGFLLRNPAIPASARRATASIPSEDGSGTGLMLPLKLS